MKLSLFSLARPMVIIWAVVSLLLGATPVFAAELSETKKSDAPADKVATPDTELEAPMKRMSFRAVDADTQKPIAGMKLNVSVMFERSRMMPGPYFTDDEGKATVEFMEGVSYVHIRTVHDSYPPRLISWEKQRGDTIPADYLYKAEIGESIGGRVVNEKGEPVVDVTLAVTVVMNEQDRASTERFDMGKHAERTNDEGVWSCAHIPKVAKSRFLIALNHPDYIATTFVADGSGNNLAGDRVSMADLRASKARLVLKEGILLTGLIVDAEGKGVSGARVRLGERWGNRPTPPQDTDLDGRFTFEHCAPGEIPLTVIADGFAPSVQKINLSPGMKELELKLIKGAILKGRVVDANGAAISGAQVNLQNFGNNQNQTVEWSTRTDEEGRFIWDGAPNEMVMLGVSRKDYINLNGQQVTPGDQEHLFKLAKAPRVVIKVVDAETKRPIDEFKVTPGQQFGDSTEQVHWQPWQSKTGSDGEYSLTWSESEKFAVKVEAKGYLPEIGRNQSKQGEEVVLSFEMKKGSGLGGTVVLADGKPASGAELVLRGVGSSYLSLGRGGFGNRQQDTKIVTADAGGAFLFEPEAEPRMIYAVHNSGYAEVAAANFKSNEPIKLQSWGRVEGVLKIKRKPAANQSVLLMPGMVWGPDSIQYDYEEFKTSTDADGKFAFAKVPPGDRMLVRMVQRDQNSWMHSMNTSVAVKPGETTVVAMGGTGRGVVGKIVPSDATKQINWKSGGFSQLSTRFPQPPRGLKTQEDIMKWQQSDEFKKAAAQHRSFPLEFAEDGSFSVDAVTPGEYDLNVRIHEPGEGGNPNMARLIGQLMKQVVVTDGAGDDDMDLGTLTLRISKPAKVGEAAPGILAKDHEGKEVKLEDFKGRHLLLHVWTSRWAAAPTNELAGLRALAAEAGNGIRLAILSIALDDDAKAAKEASDARQMTWKQAVIGNAEMMPLYTDYAMTSMPALFLIGPDGKLLARDIPGATVKEIVDKFLGDIQANAAPAKAERK